MFKLLSQVLPQHRFHVQQDTTKAPMDNLPVMLQRQDIIQTVQSLTKLVAQKLLSARFHVQQEHINLLLLKAPATSQMLDTSLKDQQEVMEFPTQ